VILHVTRSHKRTKDVVTRRVFESPNAFGGRAPPGPAGGASALPQTHELKSGDTEAYSPTSKGKGENGRERKGEKTEGRGGNCLLFMSLLATHLAISLKSEKERLLTVEERAICNVSVLMG